MSNDALTWAWRQDTRSSGERLVLLALADHASQQDDDPPGILRCWPRVSRLAEMTDLSDSTIRGHLVALDERDLVSKAKRRRRRSGHLGSWEYTLDLRSTERPTADPSAVATADRPTQASADRPARREPEGENPKRSNERDARPTDDEVKELAGWFAGLPDDDERVVFWTPLIAPLGRRFSISYGAVRRHFPTLSGQRARDDAGPRSPSGSIVDRIDRVRKGDTP